MKQFLLYTLRWMLGGVVLSPILALFYSLGPFIANVLTSIVGAIIFYLVDKWIFKTK